MVVDFKFAPLQYVKVHHFDLHCDGRIIRCIQDVGGPCIYSVDYCIDGQIKRQEFFEDELTAK